ncbi:hypothetical protein [Butyrivibrio sp. MB2005]|uniref:hypothetical protein n=1 Tax=Butyrivibrio sp. MB2005 TaxID=1280678 RepID=UPI0004796CB0|nr:hypothetical protein [Butyrivibrio sp. MB2005]
MHLVKSDKKNSLVKLPLVHRYNIKNGVHASGGIYIGRCRDWYRGCDLKVAVSVKYDGEEKEVYSIPIYEGEFFPFEFDISIDDMDYENVIICWKWYCDGVEQINDSYPIYLMNYEIK